MKHFDEASCVERANPVDSNGFDRLASEIRLAFEFQTVQSSSEQRLSITFHSNVACRHSQRHPGIGAAVVKALR